MEYNTQKYQFNQDGRDFVVSTGLVGNRIRITCQENLALDGPFYSNEFTLDDLRHANQFFMLPQTPEEALEEINKGIERQRSALSQGMNDTMIFIGYVVIGTDNDSYNLPLRRDYEPNKYGIFTPPRSNAADLVLQSNYQVDGGRLNAAEAGSGDLQREQTVLEEELNRIIPEINKLRKFSLDIKEENALIKERLKILQDQLEDRKRSVFKLKEENENLKRENQELTNYIKNQENIIRERQALQIAIKVKSRPNISHGKSAITSKFEQSALRTFLPRTVAKPVTEDYIQKNVYNPPKTATIITQQVVQAEPTQQYVVIPSSNENVLEPKILPTVYRTEKVISPQPIIIQEDHPDVAYSTKPNIGDDMNFSSKQYIISNQAYIPTNPIKNGNYRVKTPNLRNKDYSGYISSKNAGIQDLPYTSSGTKNVTYTSSGVRDLPYTSSGERNIGYTSSGARNVPYSNSGESNAPYSSSGARNVPYTSSGERNAPYSSTGRRDVPYTSNGERDKDVPYTSQRSISKKDKGYTSTQINQKDMANGSQISTNSNIGGYSSQMANNLGDSANEGYSSQMAQAAEKYIKKPKGSRAPNINQGNYNNKVKGSRAPNISKYRDNRGPDVGYSSYKK